MALESLIVLALILVISYFCARTGRRGTGLAILVLGIAPVMNLLGLWLASPLSQLVGNQLQWRMLLVILGLLIQGAILGAISRGIQKKAVRRSYLAVCGGFTVMMAFLTILWILPFI